MFCQPTVEQSRDGVKWRLSGWTKPPEKGIIGVTDRSQPFGACGQGSALAHLNVSAKADTRHQVPKQDDFHRPESLRFPKLCAMAATLRALFSAEAWWSDALLAMLLLLLVELMRRLSWPLASRIVRLRYGAGTRRVLRPEREQTVRSIIASSISAFSLLAALFIFLARLVGLANVVWIIGLFSAALGLGVSPLVRDILTGAGFIFEDTMAVGEKVEIVGVSGVVEAVHLRTTRLRAPTGELYTIPNGEIRLIRNFSRGRYSTIELILRIAAADLGRTLTILEELGREIAVSEEDILEPWQILTETGILAEHTDLKLLAKARWGRAAELRVRLLAAIQARLAAAGIVLAG